MIKQRHIGGIHARIRESENPDGTIVYIHGLGESRLCFEQQDEFIRTLLGFLERPPR